MRRVRREAGALRPTWDWMKRGERDETSSTMLWQRREGRATGGQLKMRIWIFRRIWSRRPPLRLGRKEAMMDISLHRQG
jgi:hypothetical protein